MTKIGIIGGGIIGTTCGVLLSEAGHSVTIISDKDIRETTSWAAAAISCLYGVEESERSLEWLRVSNRHLERLLGIPDAGVAVVPWRRATMEERSDIPLWHTEVDVCRPLADGDDFFGFKSGVYAELYFMCVDQYYPYMMKRFEDAGGKVRRMHVNAIDDVSHEYDVVINCTGSGARDLVGDEDVTVARGQVAIVKTPKGAVHVASCDAPVYIYPRGEYCVAGGSYDVGDWNTQIDDALTERIINGVSELVPEFATAEIVDVRVGLRPLRPTVRLEKDTAKDGTPIIHNYGHGGAGYTLSWGCAEDVLNLVQTL